MLNAAHKEPAMSTTEKPATDSKPGLVGLAIPRSQRTRQRSVIAPAELTAAGNVLLRVGRENMAWPYGNGGWTQTEPVVLTAEEARRHAEQVLALLDGEVVA